MTSFASMRTILLITFNKVNVFYPAFACLFGNSITQNVIIR